MWVNNFSGAIFQYLLWDWFSQKADFFFFCFRSPEIFTDILKSMAEFWKVAHIEQYNKNHYHQGWEQQGPFIPDLCEFGFAWLYLVCLSQDFFFFFLIQKKSKKLIHFLSIQGVLVAGWDLLLFLPRWKGWNVPFAGAAEKIHRGLTKPGRETENNIFFPSYENLQHLSSFVHRLLMLHW